MLTQCVSVFHVFLITNGRHFPTQQQVLRSASLNVARLLYVRPEQTLCNMPTFRRRSPSSVSEHLLVEFVVGKLALG